MKNKYKVSLGLGCWLLFCLIMIGILTKANWIRTLDTIGYYLTQPTTQAKTAFLTEVTFLGDPITVMLVTVGLMLLLWRSKHPTDSVWYGMIQFIGYCLVILVKYSVVRIRPTARLINVSGYSFPSGHTFSTTIFTLTVITILYYFANNNWQKAIITLSGAVWIIIIMYSRVYLRAHFTTDVLGGLLLASGWWLLTMPLRYYFFHWLWKPIVNLLNN